MFKLVRWLFLLGIIAGLTAFLVGKPVGGRTPAESFCKLVDNAECQKLAARGAAEVAWLRSRWENAAGSAPSHALPPAKTAAREPAPAKPRPAPAAPPAPVAEAPAPTAAPLDRHTDTERRALDRILSQRGSR